MNFFLCPNIFQNISFCVEQKKLSFKKGVFVVIFGSSKNIVLKMEQWKVFMDVIGSSWMQMPVNNNNNNHFKSVKN